MHGNSRLKGHDQANQEADQCDYREGIDPRHLPDKHDLIPADLSGMENGDFQGRGEFAEEGDRAFQIGPHGIGHSPHLFRNMQGPRLFQGGFFELGGSIQVQYIL